MKLYLELLLTFARIGMFTFGGGWAMLSLIEREVVDRHGWLERTDFVDLLAVAQSMPGILAVNVSTVIGDRLAGLRGSVVAALGTILPSFVIILLIAMFLTPDVIKNNATVAAVFRGIRPAVVALIVAPVLTTARSVGITWRTVAIPAAVALLIYSGLPVVGNPIFHVVAGAVAGYLYYTRRVLTGEGRER